MTEEEYKFYCQCAPRLDMMFTALYNTGWTGKYKNSKEKQTLVQLYVRMIKKMGGMTEARKIMRYLDSGLNTKHVDFPPTPVQFLRLKRDIPVEMHSKKIKLPQLSKITLTGRVYSGVTKLISGSDISKSHKDILELVKYNYKKYLEHQEKNGVPFFGGAEYNHYQIDLRGNSNILGAK